MPLVVSSEVDICDGVPGEGSSVQCCLLIACMG